jgi:eukaryotic-like serine/threonine-protein kinase
MTTVELAEEQAAHGYTEYYFGAGCGAFCSCRGSSWHQACYARLDERPFRRRERVSTTAMQTEADHDLELCGQQLDHFLLESVASRSQMATVFRATDVRDGRTVAIKIPHSEIENDKALREAFEREARIARMLEHPGMVRVFRENERSRLYIVMEWVELRSLRKIINEKGKLPPERAIRIALSICDALYYIHSEGVVHRDLKPENILVDDGGGDCIKLIDFGIALTPASQPRFLSTSQPMGTPDYISPEQVKGKRGDARSDLYAMGVILYEMLTGRVPFSESNSLLTMNARLTNDLIPPREINTEISVQLQEVIYRAMTRDCGKRYATAHEMSWDLRHLEEVDVPGHPKARRWESPTARRRKLILYFALAMIPAVLFGLLLLVAQRGT